MKNLLLILLLTTAVFGNIGKITAVKGNVTIERESSKLTAKVGDILEKKDKILTADSSKALLMFKDKTVITVGKNSEFEVESFLFDSANPPKNEAQFKFAKGIFRTITGGIGKLNKEKFVIKTKSASIGIRGTIFLVEVQPEQNLLNIGVEDGAVFMSPIDQGINPQNIGTGQALTYNDETKQFKVIPLAEAKELQVMKAESKELEDEAVESGQMKKEDTQSSKDKPTKKQPVKKDKKKEDKPTKDSTKKENKKEKQQTSESSQKKQNNKPTDSQKEQKNINNTSEKETSTNKETKTDSSATPTNTPKGNQPSSDLSNDFGDDDFQSLEKDVKTFKTNLNTPNSTSTSDSNKDTTNSQTPPNQSNNNIDTTSTVNNVNNTIDNTKDTTNDVVNENTNSAPTLKIENTTLNENESVSIIIQSNDPDGDILNYTVTSSADNEVEIINGNLNYTPNPDFYGLDTINVTADDGKGGITKTTVTFTVNNIPEITASNTALNEDTTKTIDFSVTDYDNTSLTYSISDYKNGKATLNGTQITYTPNENYFGEDSITITADDGQGGITIKTINLTVTNVPENITGDVSSITSGIQQITGSVLPQDNLNSLDFGFVVPNGETDLTNAFDTYISGTLTPDAQIQNYITNKATASYNGNIAALVNNKTTDGTINLNISFGEQKPISGSLSITEGNWQGSINNGTVTPTGFDSSSITGTSDYGTISSGNLNGKFYGVDASNVGGTLQLNTSNTSLNGVFGASGTVTPAITDE